MQHKLKNTIIYFAARGALTLVGFAPASAVRTAGRTLGALAFLIAGGERRIARTQLRNSFRHMTVPRANVITRGVFNHLGMNLVELCRLLRNRNHMAPVFIPEESRAALDDTLAGERGVVFITGHLGNWELMAAHLAREGYPIYTVAKESYDPRFTAFIESKRRTLGVHPIYRGRPGATAAMLRALKSGGVLGFLIDQDTRVKSTFAPFFGRLAHTPSGPAAFALRTDTPMVVGSIKRTIRGDHRLCIEPVTLPADEAAATAHLTQVLETRVRRQLGQWVWFHRRWKTAPAPPALPNGTPAMEKA